MERVESRSKKKTQLLCRDPPKQMSIWSSIFGQYRAPRFPPISSSRATPCGAAFTPCPFSFFICYGAARCQSPLAAQHKSAHLLLDVENMCFQGRACLRHTPPQCVPKVQPRPVHCVVYTRVPSEEPLASDCRSKKYHVGVKVTSLNRATGAPRADRLSHA
eukprot:gene14185-biopygen20086